MEEKHFWQRVEQVVDLLKQSNEILFISGAGISADSGLPTYRGISGLYNDHETDEGMPIEAALSGHVFLQHPEITWKYISQIELSCRGRSYNRGHEVLSEMEQHFRRTCILTQNVDGFHGKAGSINIIDIHGSLQDIYCTVCDYQTRVPDYGGLDIPPGCPQCNGILRPDVVLFDEVLSPQKTAHLAQELEKGFDLIFTIGTTSVFPYIAQPVVLAHYHNIPTVEINPTTTTVSELCTIRIPDKAAKTLNAIWMTYKHDL